MIQALIRLLLLGAIFVTAAESPQSTAAAQRSRVADLFDDPVVARGRGVEVKQSQVDEAFIAFKANLAIRGKTVPEDQRTMREAQILDKLILTQLLGKRANENDRKKAKEAGDKFIAEMRKQGEDSFQRSLKALGSSLQQLEERVFEQALAEAVVERELKTTITINDARVEEFYRTGVDVLVALLQQELEGLAKKPDAPPEQLAGVKRQIDEIKRANLARLEQPQKVRVSHILFATRSRDSDQELPEDEKRLKRVKIDRVLSRAQAGEDFGKLVKEYSEDRNLKETNGEYTFSRDDRFVPEFKAAAFSLEAGKISDVITTIYGYHILKLHERIPAKKVELAKAADEIREHLVQQELQRLMPEYFAKIKKDAAVEVLEARYRIELPKETASLKPGA